jgi:hypothetical protein
VDNIMVEFNKLSHHGTVGYYPLDTHFYHRLSALDFYFSHTIFTTILSPPLPLTYHHWQQHCQFFQKIKPN